MKILGINLTPRQTERQFHGICSKEDAEIVTSRFNCQDETAAQIWNAFGDRETGGIILIEAEFRIVAVFHNGY